MDTQSLIGLFGVTLLLVRAAVALSGKRRRVWMAALVFGIAWVPIGGLPLAGYVRGVTGDLSMTTVVVLVAGLAGAGSLGERRVMSGLVLSSAMFLYPMALGVGRFDPYRLGFEPFGLLVLLALVAALAWLRQFHVVLACVVVAIAAHAVGLMESTNLWDYLLDPWIALASIYDLRWIRRKS